MQNHQAIQRTDKPSALNLHIKLAIAFAPVVVYALVIARMGFGGLNEQIDQWDTENIGFAVIVHALPLFWLMFSPLFLVPGALTRPNTPVREYFTPELAMTYSPQDVSMATGAHNSRKFEIRDINENIVASGVGATIPLPSKMQLTVDGKDYVAIYDRVPEKERSNMLEHINYGSELRVFPAEADLQCEDAVLMQHVQTPYHRAPHFITFNGAADLWLKPNPETAFPRHFDMVVEDQVVGKVIQPGKLLFRGVLVVTNHYPPNVRAMIAGLCYQMMRG